MPILVEAAGLLAGLEDGDVMAMHGKPVRTGEASGAAADDGHLLSGRGLARVGMLVLLDQRVGGVALQLADLDRLALRRLAHAGFFAQGFSRADAGAHAAQDVLVENRLGGILRACRSKSGG